MFTKRGTEGKPPSKYKQVDLDQGCRTFFDLGGPSKFTALFVVVRSKFIRTQASTTEAPNTEAFATSLYTMDRSFERPESTASRAD